MFYQLNAFIINHFNEVFSEQNCFSNTLQNTPYVFQH